MRTVVNIKKEKEDIKLVGGFKPCSKKEFIDKGLKKDFVDIIGAEAFFCPDTQLINDYYKLKNTYHNKNDRFTVSYELIQCDKDYDSKCADKSLIKDFGSKFKLSQFRIEEGVDFSNVNNKFQRPISSDLAFIK